MMDKKTRRRLLLVAAPLAVLMAAGAGLALLRPPAAAAAPEPAPRYILGRHEGMVAVFLPGGTAPEYVTDAPVSCLPERDRALLEAGLPVWSEEELTRLLEDYCS